MTDAKETTAPGTRTIVLEREVPASPEEVWSALTTSEGLRQWFPLDATVDERLGGTVWLSWGPGSEGRAPIHVWEPPSRFGWTESHGEDADGRPIKVAVDFHVEGRGGSTVVRLVQSGFSASEEWDAMYDALVDGWTYFLFNLAFYFLRHRGGRRKLVWRRMATDLAREAVWERLMQAALIGTAAGAGARTAEVVLDRARPAEVVSQRAGHHWAGTLPDLDQSILFVELEGHHVGFWLSTYDMDEARTTALQKALDSRVEAALAPA
jgi:uncharacterized protein YndB with AHSA1/START domain